MSNTANNLIDFKLLKELGDAGYIITDYIIGNMKNNRSNKKNLKAKRYWFYRSIKDISEDLGLYSVDKTRKYIKQLEDQGILLSANYHKNRYLKSKWYTVIDEDVLSSFGYNKKVKPRVIPEKYKELFYELGLGEYEFRVLFSNVTAKRLYIRLDAIIDNTAEVPMEDIRIAINNLREDTYKGD